MTLKAKKIVLTSFEIAMSAMLILMLLFNLTKLTIYGIADYSENGFNLLDFESDFVLWPFEWQNTFLGVICLLIIITGFIFLVWGIFKLDFILNGRFKKVSNKDSSWSAIICWVLSFVYFLTGWISNLILISEIDLEWYYDNTMLSSSDISVSTFSYIPLIIMSVLLIIYVVIYFIKIKFKENELQTEENVIEKPQKIVNKEKQKVVKKEVVKQEDISLGSSIETLREYKKLLEEEVISQDEFDVIKASLLSKIKM